MKQLIIITSVLLLTVGCTDTAKVGEEVQIPDTVTLEAPIQAPVAKKVPYEMTAHGVTRVDDYYWMRDDKRQDPEILAHLQAEEDFTQQQMAHTSALQDSLYEELVGRLQKDESSVPVKNGNYFYQSKYLPGNEYPIYVRKKITENAEEEILLDVNLLAEGKGYFAVGTTEVSSNEQILAYSEDTVSRRVYDVKFIDLATGEYMSDTLTGTSGQVIWANDNQTVFYLKKDLQTLLSYQVFRHTLGTSQDDDVLMYEEKDNTYYTYLGKSIDNQYIEIIHDSTLNKGMSVLDANVPNGQFTLLHTIEDNLEYYAEAHNDDFYIVTNYNAPNYRVLKAHKNDVADKSKWQEIIPHSDDAFIDGIMVFEKQMVIKERTNGVLQLRVMDLATGKDRVIAFSDPVYQVRFTNNLEFSSDSVRVLYSSLTTPSTVYDVDLNTLEKTQLKQVKILGDFDPMNYKSERIFVTARDGVNVPVSLVYRKDLFKKDGSNPMLQYAYGSYGSTIDPSFNTTMLSIIDRGFVYAIAHIRGSQMMGKHWYEDGKLLTKKNTFNDFVDVTKGLVANKYAASNKVFAAGGSAGGLLMGAVVNQAPELYLGVAAMVPFVDVITTMSDASIPLTTNEYDEWGNPADKAYFDYMLSYSPYDNVEKKDYPNILVSTGLHDSQVQYFEPAKWVAKLRDYKTDDNKLLFHVNMEAGHGGASGRYRRYKDWALNFSFYLDLLNGLESSK